MNLANMVFGQYWLTEKDVKNDEEKSDDGYDNHEDDLLTPTWVSRYLEGCRCSHVKTTNITIKGNGNENKSLTTGFAPNISHSASHQAETLSVKLKTLAGEGTTLDDIISQIDFWMPDRAGDADACLDIDNERRFQLTIH